MVTYNRYQVSVSDVLEIMTLSSGEISSDLVQKQELEISLTRSSGEEPRQEESLMNGALQAGSDEM
jgi:hypothetical protein